MVIIKQTISDNDLQQLSDVSHRIKGAAGTVGAEALADVLNAIEKHAKAGESIDSELIDKLDRVVKLTIDKLSDA